MSDIDRTPEEQKYLEHMTSPIDDLDLSDDDGHAGDDWSALLEETGANRLEEENQGGEVIPFNQPAPDEEAAGYRDILETAFDSTAAFFDIDLKDREVKELARAWGRVADHYLPKCPTQESPLADALYTTGVISAPRVLAHILPAGEEGAEQEPGEGQNQGPAPAKPSPSKVVAIRPDDPNAWAKEKEREW